MNARTLVLGLLTTALAVAGCDGDETDVPSDELAAEAPSSQTFRRAVDAVLPAVVFIEVEARPRRPGRVPLPFGSGDSQPRDSGGSGSTDQLPGRTPEQRPDQPDRLPDQDPDQNPGRSPDPIPDRLPDALPDQQPQDPFGPGQPGPLPPEPEPRLGAGSGVLFSEDGYILTSNHVIRQARRVLVTLHDRRQFEARVVARDPSTDVAIVKIDAENLPVAAFGDSDRVEMGDWVLAVGSPLGLMFTATAGVVSAKGRQVGIIGQAGEDGELQAAPLEHFIQTDAAINPGNSGGPMIDLAGRVVGINTAIVSPTGVFAGIGFAVPINLARHIANDLIEHGEVRRAFLGVVLEDVTAADAKVYGLESSAGAEVVNVQADGPAGQAGIELGDVIVGIDEREIESVSELQAALAGIEPGTTARLRVVRGGDEREVSVDLGIVRSGITPEAAQDTANGPARLGFTIRDTGAPGVVVGNVRASSPAAQAGVRPGQRIVEVNGRAVENATEFTRAVQHTFEDAVSLVVEDPRLGRMIINFEVQR